MKELSPQYLSVLSFCKDFKRMVVTGSQRSGTTIAAQMIANDLSWKFVDESEVNASDFDKLRDLIDSAAKFVLQLPNLLLRTDEIHNFFTSRCVGVVAMRRPYREVEASRERINFLPRDPASEELILDLIARSRAVKSELPDFENLLSRQISLMEYRQLYITYYLESLPYVTVLDYENLQGHSMWIEKKLRLDFGPKTTTLDGPRLSQTRQ